MGTRFVDAAEYAERSRFAVTIVDCKGQVRISASIPCEYAQEAEEVAVALALTDPTCATVLCDSRQAVRNFAKGWISQRAARVLRNSKVQSEVSNAVRILSRATASGIPFMVKNYGWSQEILTTARFFKQANVWFELMSSRHPTMALSLSCKDKHSEAIRFLKKFIDMLICSNP
ncbi:hypothetical protein MTO96_029658 [Rhipicephalus appendiculatus]